ncbi:hypothetical protein RI367_006768 [Sorochytrium milnesiophthora]
MPSSTISITLLLVLVGVASALNAIHVANLLASGVSVGRNPAHLSSSDLGLDSACDSALTAYNAQPCQSAFQTNMQGINMDSPTKDDADKMVSAFSTGLTTYCSDKCAAEEKTALATLSDQCHAKRGDVSTKEGEVVSLIAWDRNYLCGHSAANNDICMADVMNTFKPVFEQYPSYAASTFAKAADPTATNTPSSEDARGAGTMMMNMPKDQFCTPCMQFFFQQTISMLPRIALLAGVSSSDASAAAEQVATKLNSKCGSDWLSTDSSRFVLDQDNAPTVKSDAMRTTSSAGLMVVAIGALVSTL